jgi:hypothetical protein
MPSIKREKIYKKCLKNPKKYIFVITTIPTATKKKEQKL